MYGQRVNGTKAKQMVASGAILIDTRDAVKFRDGTIPGAINLPLRRVSEMQRHDRRVKFVVFGDGLMMTMHCRPQSIWVCMVFRKCTFSNLRKRGINEHPERTHLHIH